MNELDFDIGESQNFKIIMPISHQQATKMVAGK